MDEMRSLQDEQRSAGLLLDEGAPLKLSVSMPGFGTRASASTAPAVATPVFGQEEDDESTKKKKVNLVKLDFSVTESTEKALERLEKIREAVPKEKEVLWKAKVRWDAVHEVSSPSMDIRNHSHA